MPTRLMTRIAMMIAVMVGVIAGFNATGTTTAHASTCTYDAHAIARVETRAVDRTEARPTHLSEVSEGTASPSGVNRGTSTTPIPSVVATEAAD